MHGHHPIRPHNDAGTTLQRVNVPELLSGLLTNTNETLRDSMRSRQALHCAICVHARDSGISRSTLNERYPVVDAIAISKASFETGCDQRSPLVYFPAVKPMG